MTLSPKVDYANGYVSPNNHAEVYCHFLCVRFLQICCTHRDLLNIRFLLTGIIWEGYTGLNSIHDNQKEWNREGKPIASL